MKPEWQELVLRLVRLIDLLSNLYFLGHDFASSPSTMTYSRTRTWICFLQIFNIGLLQSGSCKLFADANSNKNGTMIDDWNKVTLTAFAVTDIF